MVDVGGPDKVQVGGTTATVVASGADDGLDLAVLKCSTLAAIPALPLQASDQKGNQFTTAGFQLFGKEFLIRTLHGQLGEQVGLESRKRQTRIDAWDLQITDDYLLQPGYSGSPVINEASGHVLGIVSHRQGEGEKGLAISIQALATIWPKMPPQLLTGQQPITASPSTTPSTILRQDWGEAPEIPSFFGRTQELTSLKQWVVEDNCRLVTILGMGGVGKTAVAARLARQITGEFTCVLWRSLRNAPPLAEILADMLKFVSNQHDIDLPDDTSQRITHLLDYLKNTRCLLILDNVETILQKERPGHYREGYQGYGNLFRRLGEGSHQSCLLLTGREKPHNLGPMESDTGPVRAYELKGLGNQAGQKMIVNKGLIGREQAAFTLVQHYSGNPLALNLVIEMIRDVYDGQIDEFLAEDEMIFGQINDVIQEQFSRLTNLEQALLFWLAIEREPASRTTLINNLIQPISKQNLVVALHDLRRRSLIETSGQDFTLQNVIMEFMTDRLVEQVYREVITSTPQASDSSPQFLASFHPAKKDLPVALFNSHALIKATAKDYVRDSQIRLILAPLTDKLLAVFGNTAGVELQLKQVLGQLQQEVLEAPTHQLSKAGYAGGNVLNLLCHLQADLTGYDFFNLTIWQAFLRDVNLHQVNFNQADVAKTIFIDTMPSIFAATFSPNGQYLAMGDYAGEVHLWEVANRQKLFTYRGHTGQIRAVAFSPDSQTLVSGSYDNTIRIWDIQSGQSKQVITEHNGWVRALTFTPDGQHIVSASYDHTLKLWDITSGDCLTTFIGHKGGVNALALSSNGKILVSAGNDTLIKLWDMDSGQQVAELRGHTKPVFAVAISPDGYTLASGSSDYSLKLWDIQDLDKAHCLDTLHAHSNEIYSVAFSPGGQTLASCGQDQTIRLWAMTAGDSYPCISTLRGHTSWVWVVDFHPSGELLLSGSADQSVKLWDTNNVNESKCVATWQGRTDWIRDVAFNTQGTRMVSGSADKVLRIWDVATQQELITLTGHTDQVHSVVFSPNGKTVASAAWDGLAKVWDVASGHCLLTLSEHASTPWSVAFSPDGQILATGSNDTTVKLWQASTGHCLHTLTEHTAQVYAVAFSPDGRRVASGSFDSTIKLWDTASGECVATWQPDTPEMLATLAFNPAGNLLASGSRSNNIRLWQVDTGECLAELQGHTGWLFSVAFSPDGSLLASGSGDNTARLWDVNTRQQVAVLTGHTSWVHAVAFTPNGQQLATGSGDETIRLWDVETKAHLATLRAKRPYERLNISGVTGLSEAQKATLLALGAVT